jgi:hypothetical protein
MKDSEFIELLNLYLDHEIGAADAARLEAEVQKHPHRRNIYHEYCRMQKACVVLAQQSEDAAVSAPQRVVAFEPGLRWGLGTYALSLGAAAACIALVFVVRNRTVPISEPTQMPAAIAVSSPALAAAVAQAQPEGWPARSIARTVSVTPRAVELKSVLVSQALALSRDTAQTADLLPVSDSRFEWMNRVQVSSLRLVPADELVFEVKPVRPSATRTITSQRLNEGQVEWTAYQFQR